MSSTTTRRVRRTATVVAAAGAALAISAGAASAHDCFVPVYSTNAPQSANWHTLTAEDGAGWMGFEIECAGQVKAGYAALRSAGLPVGVKIFTGSNAHGDHTLAEGSANPNLSNGKGLENFHEGDELLFQIVGTFVEGASAYPC